MMERYAWSLAGPCRYLEYACRWGLALLFLYAGVPKLLDVGTFAGTVAAYGLVPDKLVVMTAFLVAALEVAAGLGLLLNLRPALLLSAGLMLLFIAVLSWGIRLGLDIDCGCFGKESAEYRAFSGLRGALARDLFLLVPLAFLLWRSQTEKNIRKE